MTMLRIAAFIFTAAFTASAAQADIKTEWVEYTHGDAKLKGYLAYDDSVTGKRPGVLMVHRRDGMTPLTLKNTEMYAKMGYVAFAPDIFGYGQGILPKDVPEMVAQMSIYTKDRALMRSRTQAGLDGAEVTQTTSSLPCPGILRFRHRPQFNLHKGRAVDMKQVGRELVCVMSSKAACANSAAAST